MESIGRQFRAVRESKGVTTFQAATAINSKQQTVEEVEADRLDLMPAPIYAKGFIRAYAEYLGIDAQPLLDAYVEQYQAPKTRVRVEKKSHPLRNASILKQRPPPRPAPAAAVEEPDVDPASPSAPAPAGGASRPGLRVHLRAFKVSAIVCASLLILMLAGFVFSRAVQSNELRRAEKTMSLVCPPPPPYAP